MNFFAVSALVNVITSAILGSLVLSRSVRNRMYLVFFLFAASISFWSFSYFMWQVADTRDLALRWVQLLMAGAVFIPFFYFHFIATFLGRERKDRVLIIIGYLVALSYVPIVFTHYFISDVSSKSIFPFWPTAGPLYLPFLSIWIFYAAYPVYLILEKLRTATSLEHSQLNYILLGTVIGYVGGSTNYFLWYDIPILPYGNISASIYVTLVAYAILKHHLFNLKVVATELFTYALWIFLFVRMLLSESAQDQVINAGLLFATLIVGTLLIRSVAREVEVREQVEQLARDLKVANERLKELDKMKSEFLSIASHQLRSPVTAIRGYASLIAEGTFGAVPAAISEAVDRISESGRVLASAIEDYLNVSRIEQGRMKYDFAILDIRRLVENAVNEQQSSALRSNLKLSFLAEGDDAFKARADAGKLKQVFSNLIDNAIKYTPKGSVTVSLKKSDDKILVAIKDTGVGIDQATLQTLFRKFTRANDASKTNMNGTGLGLYVAKELTKAHDGRVWAESRGKGMGTTFFVELPEVR